MGSASTVLDRILAKRRERLEESRRRRPLAELRPAALGARAPRDFAGALAGAEGAPRIIAEIKRRSPSRGLLRAEVDVPALARAYAAGGGEAISVLTETDHFGGSLEDVRAVREATSLPILRKDFMTDPYQLYEAREAGADAVLLIVAALEQAALEQLAGLAAELGLAALVEVHDAAEIERALRSRAPLVGINNRDLRTLAVCLDTSVRLAPLVPRDRTVLAESGIHGQEDIRLLRGAGIHAFLIGEHLMLSPDPTGALRALKGVLT